MPSEAVAFCTLELRLDGLHIGVRGVTADGKEILAVDRKVKMVHPGELRGRFPSLECRTMPDAGFAHLAKGLDGIAGSFGQQERECDSHECPRWGARVLLVDDAESCD